MRYKMDGPQGDRYTREDQLDPCHKEEEWECPDCDGAGEWYDGQDIEHFCEMCGGTGRVDDPHQASMREDRQ